MTYRAAGCIDCYCVDSWLGTAYHERHVGRTAWLKDHASSVQGLG